MVVTDDIRQANAHADSVSVPPGAGKTRLFAAACGQRVKRTPKRKPTLARVKRDADRAGIQAAAFDVRADGTISVIVGNPMPAAIGANDDEAPDRSEWH
jgi:hypothetical protein